MWHGARGTVQTHGMSRERQAVGSHPVATDLSCAMAASTLWGAGLSALTMPRLLGNTWLPCMHKRGWAQCPASSWLGDHPAWAAWSWLCPPASPTDPQLCLCLVFTKSRLGPARTGAAATSGAGGHCSRAG